MRIMINNRNGRVNTRPRLIPSTFRAANLHPISITKKNARTSLLQAVRTHCFGRAPLFRDIYDLSGGQLAFAEPVMKRDFPRTHIVFFGNGFERFFLLHDHQPQLPELLLPLPAREQVFPLHLLVGLALRGCGCGCGCGCGGCGCSLFRFARFRLRRRVLNERSESERLAACRLCRGRRRLDGGRALMPKPTFTSFFSSAGCAGCSCCSSCSSWADSGASAGSAAATLCTDAFSDASVRGSSGVHPFCRSS